MWKHGAGFLVVDLDFLSDVMSSSLRLRIICAQLERFSSLVAPRYQRSYESLPENLSDRPSSDRL